MKKLLARVVVGTFNHFDKEVISEAERLFSQKFGQSKELIPDDIVNHNADQGKRLLDLVRDLTGKSGRELKEIAKAGGISQLVGESYQTISPESLLDGTFNNEMIIRVGKRQYFRISPNQEG